MKKKAYSWQMAKAAVKFRPKAICIFDMVYLSKSPSATQKFSFWLAKFLKRGDIVCLMGELGSGKTTFIKGLAGYFGLKKNEIVSNSYLGLREYEAKISLYHFDAYRLNGKTFLWDDFYIGLYEKKALIIIEWADRILTALDKDAVKITLKKQGQNQREIIVEGMEDRIKHESFSN